MSLEDLDVVEFPIGVFEDRRIAANIDGAARLTSEACAPASCSPCAASEVAAEGCVDDEAVVGKVIVDVTVWSIENGIGLSPVGGIGSVARANIRRNGSSGEEPDLDGSRCPFHCVDTAVDRVEAGTVALGRIIRDTATDCVIIVI